MKCADCLKEIDEKEYYNKSNEGICKKCRQRMSQVKYENKKFGTNKEYIPLRLKENGVKKVVNKKTNETVATAKVEIEEKIYDKDIENKVLKDITNTFSKNKISINPQEVPPFNIFMDMFCSLIDIEKGYMSEYIKAEDVFNRMERDYQHAYEDANTPKIFDERSKMFRCLLDQRRTVKNGLGQYNKIFRLLQEIVQSTPDVLPKALQAKDELDKIIELQKNHSYRIEASELIAEQEFCTGRKEMQNEYAKYNVTVPLMNYYGNGSPYPFQRYFMANSEKEAKRMAEEFLKSKFSNCTYKPIDLIATKVVDNEEETVCL